MKNIKTPTLYLLCLLLCSLSCKKEIFDCDFKTGPEEIRTISLDDIEGFELESDINLTIIEGDTQKIVINSYTKMIDKLLEDSELRNGIWKIKFDGCSNSLGDSDIKITATISELSSVEINGSGDIKTQGTFNNINDLNLKISGSGDMDLQLGTNIDELKVETSGSGNYQISGEADDQKIEISGSGDYNGFGMKTRVTEIDVSGSGDCEVHVEESLNVKISGSGDVCYRGSPTVETDISGSGDIKNCN